MTDQVRDNVTFEGNGWALAGVAGYGLFTPEAYGVTPAEMTTACYRGYLCDYSVTRDAGLTLCALLARVEGAQADEARAAGTGPLLFGVAPDPMDRLEFGFRWRFGSDGQPVAYTGGMLIGRNPNDRIAQVLRLRRYLYPGADFDQVTELLFEDGRLLEASDRSAAFAALRDIFDGPRHRSYCSAKGRDRTRAWERKWMAWHYEDPPD